MALNGIDVASWQPATIGDAVDYDFIITKATEGTNYVNPNCDPVAQSAIKRGKLWGTYHFATKGDAWAQADYYLKTIEGYVGKGIMALDFEADALKQGYSWAHDFCKRIIDKTGIAPLLYASASPMQQYGLAKLSSELGVGIWVAAYPNNVIQGYSQPDAPLPAAIYQYCSQGRLDGYGGNLDLNVFYGDAAAWTALATGSKAPVRKKVTLWQWHGGPNQQWLVVAQPDGSVALKNVASGLYLDVSGSHDKEGAEVICYPWHGGDNQRWTLGAEQFGLATLATFTTALPSGRHLDINGAGMLNGAKVIIYHATNGLNQAFALVPVWGSGAYYIIPAHAPNMCLDCNM
jgi:GH25 family lysozyme M1 (1,4-beta-N-acetylmuramidase)